MTNDKVHFRRVNQSFLYNLDRPSEIGNVPKQPIWALKAGIPIGDLKALCGREFLHFAAVALKQARRIIFNHLYMSQCLQIHKMSRKCDFQRKIWSLISFMALRSFLSFAWDFLPDPCYSPDLPLSEYHWSVSVKRAVKENNTKE